MPQRPSTPITQVRAAGRLLAPHRLANYVGLETEASSVLSFELELIPGLLQTEQYAREIHALRGQPPDDLERRVKARLRRQERLTASDPCNYPR